MYGAYHLIDACSTPVGYRHILGFVHQLAAAVFVRRAAIGVEVIIHHQTVDVVVTNDLHQHLQYVLACIGMPRVKDRAFVLPIVVREQPFRVIDAYRIGVLRGDIGFYIQYALAGGALVAERVNPCMQFHAALVRLLNGVRQGIIARVHTAYTRQNRTPRLVTRLIHSICRRTSLKTYRVDVPLLQLVEHLRHLCLLRRDGFRAHAINRSHRPVDVLECREPCSTELRTRRMRLRIMHKRHNQQYYDIHLLHSIHRMRLQSYEFFCIFANFYARNTPFLPNFSLFAFFFAQKCIFLLLFSFFFVSLRVIL